LAHWWLSPQRVIALFPDWFAEPQPDWSPVVRMTGFPLFDREDQDTNLPSDVAAFLDAGTPPIVFTPGTGNTHDHDFFRTAVEVCHMLDRRAMLLTPFASQVPSDLPRSIRHFAYLPFSQVLPQAAAIVHHGGIGTTSQAMAAGIPQLVIPLVNDQPDNAVRVKELGVGDWLKPRAFRASTVARKLGPLLTSRAIAGRCEDVQDRIKSQDALGETCELIEQVGEGT
jgi:UDP:flavonoid glycosyltransferase YjiC (YdhE family)